MVTASGHSTTTYTGGNPIVAGSHDQGLIVKMFKDGDPKGANAISARATLGPKWQETIKESAATTCWGPKILDQHGILEIHPIVLTRSPRIVVGSMMARWVVLPIQLLHSTWCFQTW
jgi:hypothetical protein